MKSPPGSGRVSGATDLTTCTDDPGGGVTVTASAGSLHAVVTGLLSVSPLYLAIHWKRPGWVVVKGSDW